MLDLVHVLLLRGDEDVHGGLVDIERLGRGLGSRILPIACIPVRSARTIRGHLLLAIPCTCMQQILIFALPTHLD